MGATQRELLARRGPCEPYAVARGSTLPKPHRLRPASLSTSARVALEKTIRASPKRPRSPYTPR